MNAEASATGTARLDWFKSSHSGDEGGECIEVASAGQAVLVRDSKDVTRSHLTVGATGWADFLRYAAGR